MHGGAAPRDAAGIADLLQRNAELSHAWKKQVNAGQAEDSQTMKRFTGVGFDAFETSTDS